MRLDEWVPTRVVEAVVRGIDRTVAADRPSVATPEGIGIAAAILDDVLAAGPSPVGPLTWPTTSPGCAPRRAVRHIPTRGSR